MSVIEECEMLVNELADVLRGDPAFQLLLFQLRDCLGLALRPANPTLKKARFAEVAERLLQIWERLQSQR